MKTKSFRILLVEDDPSISLLLDGILKRLGQFVEIAANGKEAISLFTRNPRGYDILITDHNMPHVTGLEFVAHLRQNSFEGKIIVISGSLTEDLNALYRLKCVEKILQKPFVPAELSFTLNTLFGQWSRAGI